MGSIVLKDRRLTYLNNSHAFVVLMECLGVSTLGAGRLLLPDALLFLLLLLHFLPMAADVTMFIDNMHRLVHGSLVKVMGILTICSEASVRTRRSFASR